MNCCDEFGNCRQGRDCPVRAVKTPPWRQHPHTGAKLALVLVVCWLAFGLGVALGVAV